MGDQSFFSSVTKYSSDHRSDPRENRLTEAFAALLRQVDGLATKLACEWLDPVKADSARGERCSEETSAAFKLLSDEKTTVIRVRTQVLKYLSERRWVDLEIDFDCGGKEQKLRVEVKHGTGPHSEQVTDYQERDALAPPVPVVLLAPSWQLPFEDEIQAPKSAPQRSWQSTVKTIEDFPVDKDVEPVWRWMRDEFIKFAEEEGLMPPEAIDTEGAARISNLTSSTRALEELVRLARSRVGAELDDEGLSGGGKGVGSWKHYPRPCPPEGSSPWPDGMWFEFKVSDDSAIPRPTDSKADEEADEVLINTGEVVFIAGLSWFSRETSLDNAEAQSLKDLSACGEPFSELQEGGCARLMRICTPHSLVSKGDTLEEQGQALGDWVVKAFEDLNKA